MLGQHVNWLARPKLVVSEQMEHAEMLPMSSLEVFGALTRLQHAIEFVSAGASVHPPIVPLVRLQRNRIVPTT